MMVPAPVEATSPADINLVLRETCFISCFINKHSPTHSGRLHLPSSDQSGEYQCRSGDVLVFEGEKMEKERLAVVYVMSKCSLFRE